MDKHAEIMGIVCGELDNIPVEKDGRVRWTEVANAQTHIRARLHIALSALKSESRPLVEFALWAIQEGSWVGTDIPGDVVQDKAEELGLITRTKYDPEIHGESDIAEPGDDWYVFGPLIADQQKETT